MGALAAQSCGFPQHEFSDKAFYGAGGSGGYDASAGGTVAVSGGATSTGGAGGANGGTTAMGTGGLIIAREGGRSRFEGGFDTGGNPGLDAGPQDAGDAGPRCTLGLSFCSGTCVDLLSDDTHCGTCETKCVAPDICNAGNCAPPCSQGLTLCGGNCVDINSDENHCGTCSNACGTGQLCDTGTCVVDCGTLTRCGTSCFDTQTDVNHCGGCTNPCNTGEKCSGGVCSANCTTPFVNCSNTCVDTTSNQDNCGACGAPCTAQQKCVNGSCQKLVENCTNGVDDDNNGLADCADPACAAYACASTPSGWTGPIALWTGAAGAAPACSAAGPYPSGVLNAHSGLSTPGYTCPACNCAPSGGSACSSLSFYYDTTPGCTASTAWTVTVAPDGKCESVALSSATPSANSSQLEDAPSTYVTGSCVPNQGTPQFPDATWSGDVLGCGTGPSTPNGGGCAVGACVPKPKAPFGAHLCIFRSGVATCPSEYPTQTPAASQFYETWSEGRTCSTCGCGAPHCGGTVHTFTDQACTANDTVVAIDGTCSTIPQDPTQGGGGLGSRTDSRSIRWDNGGPVCGTVSSQLQGSPTPDSPVTVCCQGT